MRARVADVFAVDLRGLALFRVMVATLLLVDLAIRGANLAAWSTDAGVLPLDAIVPISSFWRFSLYFAHGGIAWAAFLHITATIAALGLLFGWRTRINVILSLVLLISLHNRNPLLLQGGDNLLLLLLFWSLFLPLGARWSVDRALAREVPGNNRYVSFGSAGILLQAMSVYFFSAFLKSSEVWLPDGTAIYYALHLDQFATGLATLWRDELWLTRPLTTYVWYLELLGPLLIFSPVARVPLRLLGVLCFVSLELGFIANLHIGLFPFISITSILLFLPTEAWDRIARWFRPRASATLFYDDGCDFCLKSCHVLRTFLMLPDAAIHTAQSDPAALRLRDDAFTWVVRVDGEDATKSRAMTALFRCSPTFFWLAPLLRLAEPVGNRVYGFVARHRGAIARVTGRLLPWQDRMALPGRIPQAVAALFIAYIGWWNLSTVSDWSVPWRGGGSGTVPFPQALTPVKNVLRLDQHWSMFAPSPSKDDGWFVWPGVLSDGTLVDARTGVETVPDFTKPENLYATQFGTYRWRKYLRRLAERSAEPHRVDYGRWLCRRLNADRPDNPLERFYLYYIREPTPPPGANSKLRGHLVWRHFCLSSETRPRPDAPLEQAIDAAIVAL